MSRSKGRLISYLVKGTNFVVGYKTAAMQEIRQLRSTPLPTENEEPVIEYILMVLNSRRVLDVIASQKPERIVMRFERMRFERVEERILLWEIATVKDNKREEIIYKQEHYSLHEYQYEFLVGRVFVCELEEYKNFTYKVSC